jgi:beta-glucosidase
MSLLFWIIVGATLFILGMVISSKDSPEPQNIRDDEQRITVILEQMSLEEKIDYIGGVDRFYIRAIPRLGIPRFKMADGPLGVRNYGPATAMAAGIALAAAWDVELAERIGVEIARDARARGVHFLLGPGVNVYRAPMNGRNFEYFGEDPFLASAIAVGYIRGVQSQGVSATVKHFIANNSEFDRRKSDAVVDERTLREIYMPAFEAAVKDARVGSIMTSYNLTNGLYMSQNGNLNNGVVKNEWGFDGIIMSDWTSTYDGIAAANGGLDLEMPSGDLMNRKNLVPAVEKGKVPLKTVDDKVRRILRTAVRFGWLDRDQTDSTIPRYNSSGCRVALDAARKSMVLLKNRGGLLPLGRENIQSLAVIGPNAHPPITVGGGSACVDPFCAVGFMKGLSDALGEDSDIFYHRGIPDLGEISKATRFYTDPSYGKQGMHLEIFDNMHLSGGPSQVCIEPQVGTTEHTCELPEPFTSARWRGYFTPPRAGTYDIFVQIPGERVGYKLYLDDNLILDTWKFSKALVNTRAVFLECESHKIVLELVRKGRGFAGGKLRLGMAQPASLVDSEAKALAGQSDAVVVAVGFNSETESESCDRTFSLPFGQDALIKEIAGINGNTIVVITSGGSVDMRDWLENIPALIQAWYPGQEGGVALAEILLGETNPSGRLPVTFEKRWEDNPSFNSYYPEADSDRVAYSEGVFVGYRGYEETNIKPQFPFGYGLSYTTYEYGALAIEQVSPIGTGEGTSDAAFKVSFDIENTGRFSGEEVAQLYVGSTGKAIHRPPKELKGFAKISLCPGEKKRVTINLNRRSFSYYDTRSKDWKVETGDREILVGRSSNEIELRGIVTLPAGKNS